MVRSVISLRNLDNDIIAQAAEAAKVSIDDVNNFLKNYEILIAKIRITQKFENKSQKSVSKVEETPGDDMPVQA